MYCLLYKLVKLYVFLDFLLYRISHDSLIFLVKIVPERPLCITMKTCLVQFFKSTFTWRLRKEGSCSVDWKDCLPLNVEMNTFRMWTCTIWWHLPQEQVKWKFAMQRINKIPSWEMGCQIINSVKFEEFSKKHKNIKQKTKPQNNKLLILRPRFRI